MKCPMISVAVSSMAFRLGVDLGSRDLTIPSINRGGFGYGIDGRWPPSRQQNTSPKPRYFSNPPCGSKMPPTTPRPSALPLTSDYKVSNCRFRHNLQTAPYAASRLQHRRTPLWTDVLDGEMLPAHVCRDRKQRAQGCHAIDVVLPNVETSSAEVNGEGAAV